MITNITDLANRTLVESNTLRSLILSSQDATRTTNRDAILIHDYQIANSVTMNSILSNFIVNFKQALKLYTSSGLTTTNSYFQIVNSVDELETLSDTTKLVLTVQDGEGSFLERKLVIDAIERETEENARKFILILSIWFSIVENTDETTQRKYETLEVSSGMNDVDTMSDYFGGNPFSDYKLVGMDCSFNEFILRNCLERSMDNRINCVVENGFFRSQFGNTIPDSNSDDILSILYYCKYFVCLSSGFYALRCLEDAGKFIGFRMYNIGIKIPTIRPVGSVDDTYEFMDCSFNVIDEYSTMFITIRGRNDGKYHYIYLNDMNYDSAYGFKVISELVSDQLVVSVQDIFHKVDSYKQLGGSTTIALTDYGFWDIESNNTDDIVYQYSNLKDIEFTPSEGQGYTGRIDKAISPLTALKLDGEYPDRVVQYDTIWKHDSNQNAYCFENLSYPDAIMTNSHGFFGGTDVFAIYDSVSSSTETTDPVKILVQLDQDQFNKLLFSNTTLLNLFVHWVFDQVVYEERGEKFLHDMHAEFARNVNNTLTKTYSQFKDQTYKVVEQDGLIPDDSKFNSVKSVVLAGNSGASTLYDYCAELNRLTTTVGDSDIEGLYESNWLLPLDQLVDKMTNQFRTTKYDDTYLETIVSGVVTQLVGAYPQLKYFTQYLLEQFRNDFKAANLSNCTVQLDKSHVKSAIGNAIEYIKGKVQTALILGGYDGSEYPNMNQFIFQTEVNLSQSTIKQALNSSVIFNGLKEAVQSTPFFNSYPTYAELQKGASESNLFEVKTNPGFAELTGFTKSSNSVTQLNINWEDIRNWLFPTEQSMSEAQNAYLKAVIRTQIYRPMFFTSKNKDTFTKNAQKYLCRTKKTYYNHDDELKELRFITDGSESDYYKATKDYTQVDAVNSGLSDTTHIKDLKYDIDANAISYSIVSDPITFSDNKFVYDGIEYFVIPNEQGNKVSTIYFNTFQTAQDSDTDSIQIDDEGGFSIKGVDYLLDYSGAYPRIRLRTQDSTLFPDRFVCEVQDDRFVLEGIIYNLVMGNSGKYESIHYVEVVDKELIKLFITEDGIGVYDQLGLEFHFTGVNSVTMLRHHQTSIIDTIVHEWCEYDDSERTFDSNRTFVWNLYDTLTDLMSEYPEQRSNILSLGDGNIYSGKLGVSGTLKFVNEVSGDDSITSCIIKMDSEGSETTIKIDTILDSNFNVPEGMVLVGELDKGLIEIDDDGSTVFILKDVEQGKNNCNTIWFPKTSWQNMLTGSFLTKAGTLEDEEGGTGTIYVISNNVFPTMPTDLVLKYDSETDRYSIEENESIAGTPLLTRSDNLINLTLGRWVGSDMVYDRYRIDLNTKEIYRLVLNDINCQTIDFSTTYGFDRLRDDMVNSIKQYMLNYILQRMVEGDGTKEQLKPTPVGLNMYIDLFSDSTSLDLFQLFTGVDASSLDYLKYKEIFKNNSFEVDSSNIHRSGVYAYVSNVISSVFRDEDHPSGVNVIKLVDNPSITVRRVDSVDKFKYDTSIDIHLIAEKSVLQNKSSRSHYENGFIIGNATIRDVVCEVEFTPKFNASGEMTYDIEYRFGKSDNTKLEYDQIIYNYGGKTKHKFIDKQVISNPDITFPTEASITKLDQPISKITTELISSSVKELITKSWIGTAYVEANRSVSQDTKFQIGSISKKNENTSYGIWNLCEDIPEDITPSAINRGYALIDNQLYQVSSDDGKLQSTSGNKSFDIIQKTTHLDSDGNTDKVFLLLGDRVVEKSTLNEMFEFKNIGGELIAVYKNDKLKPTFDKVIELGADVKCVYVKQNWNNSSGFICEELDEKTITVNKTYALIKASTTKTNEQTIGKFLDSTTPFEVTFKQGDMTDGSYEATINVAWSKEVQEWDSEYGEVQPTTDYTNIGDSWCGIPAEVKVKISNLENDIPTVSLVSTGKTCIGLSTGLEGFPSVESLKFESKAVGYSTYEIIGISDGVTKESESITEDDVEDTQYTISFKLNAKVTEENAIVIPKNKDAEYQVGELYVGYVDANSVNPCNAIKLIDFKGYSPLAFDHAIMDYPTNFAEVQALDDSSISDYTYQTIYVEHGNNDANITSDGRYCPFSLSVISPDATRQNDWEIYGRYYVTEQKVYVNHKEIKNGGSFWMDESSTIKSIHVGRDSISWKGLKEGITIDSLLDSRFPQDMRDSIEDCIETELKQQDSSFVAALTQIQTFLLSIDSELKQSLDVQKFRNFCSIGYSATVSHKQHSESQTSWKDVDVGIFGFQSPTYETSLNQFNNHLYNEFFSDHSRLEQKIDESTLKTRDYFNILKPVSGITYPFGQPSSTITNNLDAIGWVKISAVKHLYGLANVPVANGQTNTIDTIFGSKYNDSEADKATNVETVRYIGILDTTIGGKLVDMHICDDFCHLFSRNQNGSIQWNVFEIGKDYFYSELESKCADYAKYVFDPPKKITQFQLSSDSDCIFRYANRNLSDRLDISDAYVVRCVETTKTGTESKLWYLSELSGYIYSSDEIVDMVYDQFTDSVYVIFADDSLVYRYDGLSKNKDSQNRILISKGTATRRIVTRLTTLVSDSVISTKYISLDYPNENSPAIFKIYSEYNGSPVVERFIGNVAGSGLGNFAQYNDILFGDGEFSENQLKFQNISKHKEMFDILDVDEVDGCYYGIFKNDQLSEERGVDTYTVFKSPSDESSVIERLPYEVVIPSLIRTADWLYSLYALVRIPYESSSGETKYRVRLQEISIPNSDIYAHRNIEIQDAIISDMTYEDVEKGRDEVSIYQIFASEFIPGKRNAPLYALTNRGFHQIKYVSEYNQLSIDTLDSLKEILSSETSGDGSSLFDVIDLHVKTKHKEKLGYFETIASKFNQFKDGFSVFSLIPTEFGQTQDVGVVPVGEVITGDETTDHRTNSLQVTTDILWTDGLSLNSDQNPGLIIAAVSNPATIYDDDSVFGKSQRNPELEGTEFYDYIYDNDGNELMNLYNIPFVYRISSNNTYDLYVNIPTTRTKYLNRVAGTLQDDLTSRVSTDDTRTRLNFQTEDEPMVNNLTESTTKLRIYIDRKYISIGNVELVEICGNSIPCLIYRDTVNNGLYDSIALESRWNGEITEINDPAKDINKVMMEFECYGTDSQSIHISGKILTNKYLDDATYDQVE